MLKYAFKGQKCQKVLKKVRLISFQILLNRFVQKQFSFNTNRKKSVKS